MELLLITLAIYFFIKGRKNKVKKGDIDAQLRELIDSENDSTGVAVEIKNYLLAVLEDDKNDKEKYSDEKLAWGKSILDKSGAAGFYFMSDIACQLALLTTATANNIPTQLDLNSDQVITPEYIINSVIKI